MRLAAILFIVCILNDCSAKFSLRSIGGRDAKPGEFPYVVRLEIEIQDTSKGVKKMIHVCTGFVITSAWTLTAAHCLLDYLEDIKHATPNKTYYIRYGSVHARPESKDAFSNIIAAFTHLNYRYHFSSQRDSLILFGRSSGTQNDIGIIKTDPIKLLEYGKLSAVPYRALTGLEVVAAGYGLTNSSSGEYKNTLELKKPLQIIKVLIRRCTGRTVSVYPELCLSPPCSNLNYIQPGDSGGPAIHSSGMVGIASTNLIGRLGLDDSYILREAGQFTPVSPYLDWIFSYIK